MKKILIILLASCMIMSLTACSNKPDFSSYNVDGIVEILFRDIDTVCESEELASAGTKFLNVMQNKDEILLSFVVDHSIGMTNDELGKYDHLVVTNPEWINRFGDASKLQLIGFEDLSTEMQDFFKVQMPEWTIDGSVLPDGVSLYEYNDASLLAFPANVGYVDAILSETPLIIMVDNPVESMKAKSFLLPLASSTNLVFTNSQNLKVELDKSIIHSYVNSIGNIKLQSK